MKNVRKPSLYFGLFTAIVFFIGFFLMASDNEYGNYFLYAGLALGLIFWIWSIIEVVGATDLKKYQKTFWLIIVVAVPFFGAMIFNILHRTQNKMVA